MKLSRKLLPALAMLIVSAVMLSTASFAWFAMNQSVEANGMTVNIKSDSVYLLISTSSDKDAINSAKSTTATAQALAADDVFPTAHNVTAASGVASDFATPGNWYTKTANDPSTSASSGAEVPLTAENLGDHVVTYTYYVVLATGSEPASNLTVSDVEITGTGVDPVRVVVTCTGSDEAGGWKELSSEDNAAISATAPGTAVLASEVTADTVLTITVYVYYDGNDEAVFTNNMSNLSDAQINFNLAVSQPAA